MSLPASNLPDAGVTDDLIRVRDSTETLEFSGVLIGQASTELPDKPRWLELRLYRVTDGSNRYVIARIGKSLVYHNASGGCNRGVSMAAVDLPRDAVPCSFCSPPGRAIIGTLPGTHVNAETEHHGAEVVDSAAAAVQALRMTSEDPGRGRGIGGAFSEPALRLLAEARQQDPGVNDALSKVRKI